MNGNNFLKEIGRSYIVSAFLPAAFFTLIGFFLFRGFIPSSIADQLISSKSFINKQWIVVTLLVFWWAFFLFSANDFTVRIFEGYYFPKWLSNSILFFKKINWAKRNMPDFENWKQFNEDLLERIKNREEISDEEDDQITVNYLKAKTELANFGMRSPLDKEDILPTRLGNVMRASEMYAYERYAIEEITVWPRLVPVLPLSILEHIDEKNNHFMFLINSAFMAYLNAGFALLFGIVGLPLKLIPDKVAPLVEKTKGFFYIGYDFIHPIGYLAISLVLGLFGYILYRIGVGVAEEFSMYVRASFDLYRANLIRQFNWKPPKTLEKERELWRNISLFLIAADRMGKTELPNFEHSNNIAAQTKRKRPASRSRGGKK